MNKTKQIKLEEILPVIEEVLAAGGEVSFTPNGNSMYPLLHTGRDTITLKKCDKPLKKYDLPLYRRTNGQFILHRVVGKNKEGYIMRGDNQLVKEYGITDKNVVGIVTSYIRKGEKHSVTDFSYKLYVFLRCNEITVLLRKIKLGIRYIFRKRQVKQK
ncbi:MAG: S24/S26 family peptidase [Clostridiales bacterium]|nr:S24/S26 family peptidase [Candidatus Equinaster intestinalis]